MHLTCISPASRLYLGRCAYLLRDTPAGLDAIKAIAGRFGASVALVNAP